MEEYALSTTPKANSESVVSGPQYRFTILNDIAMRYEWSVDGIFEDRASTFALHRHFPKSDFRLEDKENLLEIITPSFHLTYDKQKFSPNGFHVSFTNKQTNWGVEWRYGHSPEGNLGGTARTIDGADGRCDMGFGIISTSGYTVLDDSESMLFEYQGFVTTRRSGDRIDGYLFSYGHNYKGAMETFYAISGNSPPVPRWFLGNWWSRYHAYDSEEYCELMNKFRQSGIPLSVAVIDMDWHIVKGDNVPHSGWTGYTWNKELFSDPEGFTKALHDRHLKVTLNDHPHAGVHHHEDMYEEMAAVLGHDTTNRDPIKFDPTSPEYMNAYLKVLHRSLEARGCDFWWIDWQQGPISRIPGIDPLWVLNHFQYLDSVKQKGKEEALVFSRYAGPGSHRYPVGFSGDSVATWASLAFQPEFTATASNIGYGWWSHDIGGHCGGTRDDECLARWVQFGVFSPIMRLHSSDSRWMSKEPWLYRHEAEIVLENFLKLRHRLVPYIYSLTVPSTAQNSKPLPLVQPMYWKWPTNDSAYKYRNEYLFGSSLIVAPIVEPRDPRTNLAKTKAWIPPGRHVDIFTGRVYDGDQEIDLYRSIRQIPVLAGEGAILPLDGKFSPPNGCPNPTSWEVCVVVGQDGHFEIIEDERDDEPSMTKDGGKRVIPIYYSQASGRLECISTGRSWTFRFLSTDIAPSRVRILINGIESGTGECVVTRKSYGIPDTEVKIPAQEQPDSRITIDLGPNPQLAIIDPKPHLEALILDFQISNDMKDNIWNVLESTQPTIIKMSRLLALDLEASWVGPLVEILLGDSRSEH